MTARSHRGGTLVNILALLMALEITALGLFGGFLILTGRLNETKLWLLGEVYEGRLDGETLAMAQQWQQYQDQEAARKAAIPAGASAPVKLAAGTVEQQSAQLMNQWQLQEIQALKSELEQQIQQLRQARADLEQQQKKLEEQRRSGSQDKEASFQEMLQIVSRMKPPATKEVLLQMEMETVVRILREMDARAAAKVLAEFRSPEEVELKRRYLEMIKAGTDPAPQPM